MATHDADYLKSTVGEPLGMALTSMIADQPEDAVEVRVHPTNNKTCEGG